MKIIRGIVPSKLQSLNLTQSHGVIRKHLTPIAINKMCVLNRVQQSGKQLAKSLPLIGTLQYKL